jgi:short-subunit dehydrogenase
MKKTIIVGATSAIAYAVARILVERCAPLFLVARNPERLLQVADDLRVRSTSPIYTWVMDATDLGAHDEMLAGAEHQMSGIDMVLICHGTLPDQRACENSAHLTVSEIVTNGVSTVALLTDVARRFAAKGSGTIVVLGSVAGDRGRESNYVYGSAKAMVATFMSGLRQRLSKQGVRVITIKPGLVDTPMTSEFPKSPIWSSPEAVAAGIVSSIDRSQGVVYLPWYWRWIMSVIRAIPDFIYRRVRL